MKIETFDKDGVSTGYLIPIWSALERPDLRPDQVYLTVIAPHSHKGPHLHMKRRGMFVCLSGQVTLVKVYPDGTRATVYKEPNSGFSLVLPGVSCALYNYGDTEALVLNMPSPAWSKDDPDDWPVEGWTDPPDWCTS